MSLVIDEGLVIVLVSTSPDDPPYIIGPRDEDAARSLVDTIRAEEPTWSVEILRYDDAENMNDTVSKYQVIAAALRVASDLAATPPPAPRPMRTVIDRDPETGTIVGAHEEVA